MQGRAEAWFDRAVVGVAGFGTFGTHRSRTFRDGAPVASFRITMSWSSSSPMRSLRVTKPRAAATMKVALGAEVCTSVNQLHHRVGTCRSSPSRFSARRAANPFILVYSLSILIDCNARASDWPVAGVNRFRVQAIARRDRQDRVACWPLRSSILLHGEIWPCSFAYLGRQLVSTGIILVLRDAETRSNSVQVVAHADHVLRGRGTELAGLSVIDETSAGRCRCRQDSELPWLGYFTTPAAAGSTNSRRAGSAWS